ncbi:MAG: ABC transporter permease [Campylobacterota bacterium]|nr:ABC transporter permease [Campylobacterota bacterium]
MIRSLPNSTGYKIGYRIYITIFFLFLVMPLIAISVLAFNDSNFIAFPWEGFTLDWFFADTDDREGVFIDQDLLDSIYTSLTTGFVVAVLSTIVGTMAALLFEEEKFRFKGFLYFLAITPLVLPGVILGISILLGATYIGEILEVRFGIDMEILRPSYWLVVLGQFAFAATYVMLLVSARLKKYDRTLEEAALSLKATRIETIWYVTLPYLRPAIIAAFVVAFLLSFSNINTTIFLIGSDPTMPIDLYSRIRFSSTPVLNAISFLIVLLISIFAFINFFMSKR